MSLPTPDSLRGFRAVSFDIFDTLVVRPFLAPTDVFALLQPLVDQAVAGRRLDFKDLRVRAEATARRLAWEREGRVEIRLEEIYRVLADDLDEGLLARLAEEELALEQRIARPRSEVVALFNALKAQGTRIVLASDMYLPRACVEGILAGCGICGHERLFLSSDDYRTKASGGMYEDMLGRLGLSPGALCHIGDNPDSDKRVPEERGIRAFLIPKVAGSADRLTLASHAQRAAGSGAGADFWRSFLHGARLADAGAEGRGSYWEDLGFALVGPLVLGFARFIREHCAREGIRRIYFLARDGLIVRTLYDTLFTGEGTRTHYLLASRRCVNFAGIHQVDDEALGFLCSGTTRLRAADFLRRIGLDAEDPHVRGPLSELFPDPREVVNDGEQYARLRELFRRLEARISADARRERESYLDYLDSEGLGREDAAVVDIGWHGSLQQSLVNLLHREGRLQARIHGLYLGTYTHAKRSCQAGELTLRGWLFDYGEPVDRVELFRECIEVIELLLAAPELGIVSVERRGKGFAARRDDSPGEAHRLAVSRGIHAGVARFARAVQALGTGADRLAPVEGYVLGMVESLLRDPAGADIAAFGSVRHAEGFGVAEYRPLIATPPWHTDMRSLYRMQAEAFWPRAFVAGLSGFQKAQLDAYTRVRPLLVSVKRALLQGRLAGQREQ